jgi:hypothetical protein
MPEASPGKTRRPGMFTKSVNFPGTLAGTRKSRRAIDLRSLPIRSEPWQTTPLPPPGRSLLSVISTPDFFHPSSPHMSPFPVFSTFQPLNRP